MAEYGWFVCNDCRNELFLGKAVKRQASDGDGYSDVVDHYACGQSELPNSRQSDLTRSLWKMMAEHTGHHVEIIREYSERGAQFLEIDPPYRSLDKEADLPHEVSFDEYLKDFRG